MTTEMNSVGLTDLTYLAFSLNRAIESGRYDTLPIDEVHRAIRDGTIFAYIKAKLGSDIDLSIFDADAKVKVELLAEWHDMEVAVEAKPKFKVIHRGLPLLFAFLLEGIQRRTQKAA